MKRILFFTFILLAATVYPQAQTSSISSLPGAFSRMGFGARGIGMGNAMSAVTEGNLVSYYNPALSVFQSDNSFQTSYSFLSLDRSLNFLSFTRRFDFYSPQDTITETRKPRSSAGVSGGIINAGVSGIESRDNQGLKRGDLSTSENQFFLGLANRFSEKFSIGIAVKFYYYSLYEDVTSTALGLDIGAIYRINKNWNVAVSVSDINAKYKWDTSGLYGTNRGVNSENKFPVLKKLGVRYFNPEYKLLVAGEFENSNAQTSIIRAGVEYNIYDQLYLRAGLDQWNLKNSDFLPKPAAGFSYFKILGSLLVGVDYAFMIEQYSSSDRHIVGVSVNF